MRETLLIELYGSFETLLCFVSLQCVSLTEQVLSNFKIVYTYFFKVAVSVSLYSFEKDHGHFANGGLSLCCSVHGRSDL